MGAIAYCFGGSGGPTILNITPGTQSLGEVPKTWFSLGSAGFFVHFFVEPLSNQQFFWPSEFRAPMFRNSKTRYFTRLPFFFEQKSWSLGLGVSFCFSCKLRAPALCDPTCWLFCHFLSV